jgi:hypothetical protein
MPPGWIQNLPIKRRLEAAEVRERTCLALVVGIDFYVAARQSDSRPARIAVVIPGASMNIRPVIRSFGHVPHLFPARRLGEPELRPD